MTNSRLAIVGLATGMLVATPALAGNGRAAPAACSGPTVEQIGPKFLPCTGSSPQRTIPATKGGIQVTLRMLCEDELGPKYLLSHC